MGQKVHPYGIRLGYIKPWKAKWFSEKNYATQLHEDLKVRKYLKEKLGYAGISNIEIERSSGRVRVRIHTARPGVIIGRRGQEIDKVKEGLADITGSELFVDIKEVKSPQTDAQLVAENVAMQLQKRIGFRRAMKKTVQMAMTRGALGIKIICKGRLGGADIARAEKYRDGKVPLSTFRADVDYGSATARTTYGAIGCKVWIYKGDVLVKKAAKEAQEALKQKFPGEPDEEKKEKPKKKVAKAATKAKAKKAPAKKKAATKKAKPKADAEKSAKKKESDV